jgi:flagellar biosynthesis protein FlhB
LNSSLERTSKAKLVVNNPTHISVALDYEPGIHDLPFILAMETDDMALLMRRQALAAGIPLVTQIELARGLYRDGEVDSYIPSQHVALAAEVFRQVLEQLKQGSAEPADLPRDPPDGEARG